VDIKWREALGGQRRHCGRDDSFCEDRRDRPEQWSHSKGLDVCSACG